MWDLFEFLNFVLQALVSHSLKPFEFIIPAISFQMILFFFLGSLKLSLVVLAVYFQQL